MSEKSNRKTFQKKLERILRNKALAVTSLIGEAIEAQIPVDVLVCAKSQIDLTWNLLAVNGIQRGNAMVSILPDLPESLNPTHFYVRFDNIVCR